MQTTSRGRIGVSQSQIKILILNPEKFKMQTENLQMLLLKQKGERRLKTSPGRVGVARFQTRDPQIMSVRTYHCATQVGALTLP